MWRQNEDEDIKDYVLTTVTFETASAPHTAVRTMKQIALEDKEKYPLRAQALEEDFYVDDVMTGASSYEEAKEK